MHAGHQERYLIRIGGPLDAVAQIENVPRRSSGLFQNPIHLSSELVPGREKRRRVQIPLYGDFLTEDGPRS